MAGLVPAIHVFAVSGEDVNARYKTGHDELNKLRGDGTRQSRPRQKIKVAAFVGLRHALDMEPGVAAGRLGMTSRACTHKFATAASHPRADIGAGMSRTAKCQTQTFKPGHDGQANVNNLKACGQNL